MSKQIKKIKKGAPKKPIDQRKIPKNVYWPIKLKEKLEHEAKIKSIPFSTLIVNICKLYYKEL